MREGVFLHLLDTVTLPEALKALDAEQLPALCAEIREFLIENVSRTGGHLSSNLGTVELTVALHRVFDSPIDELIWDVGHQCYTHKILTGRAGGFSALRQQGGLSGFPCPAESEHDIFIAGHGNTSISAAIGLAQAKRIRGEKGKVIAIVGDGAFTGGMIYEGMNNIRALRNLIVILNDNKMSISKNIGSMAQYLTKLRTNPGYFKAKRDVQSALDSVPLVGVPIRQGLQAVKGAVRRMMYHSTMFEEMGFQYAGPVDGHDVAALCELFQAFRDEQVAPLFLHICTQKGKGYAPAEENPGEFHGVSAFDLKAKLDPDLAKEDSFSTVFGKELAQLGTSDPSLCAVTAAMKYGTGLQYFYRQHKDRFFDVGMAEQHAVTFGAGLARGGMRPVVAIYSTFLQRGYDQLIHDVHLQNLGVLFAIDRAGLVPGDGETHQGIYDAAYLSELEHMRVASPANYAELRFWLKKALYEWDGPRAIRYPRGKEDKRLADLGCSGQEYDIYRAKTPAKAVIVSYSGEAAEALDAARLAGEQGIAADVCKLCVIHPLPAHLAQELCAYDTIIFAEECIRNGGIGEHLSEALLQQGWHGHWRHLAAPNTGIDHASVAQLRKLLGLDAAGILQALKEECT